jgi:hypothetical protein
MLQDPVTGVHTVFNCGRRASQQGLVYSLQVFKHTNQRLGWAVRTLVDIPKVLPLQLNCCILYSERTEFVACYHCKL